MKNKTETPKPKFDLFELLKNIDKGNISYYDNLPLESRKGFAPVVVMRWLTGNSNNKINGINTFLNPIVFPLYKHISLLYRLMIVSSDGHQKRYKWHKMEKKSKVIPTDNLKIIKSFYDCSFKEAVELEKLLNEDDIKEMSDTLGL